MIMTPIKAIVSMSVGSAGVFGVLCLAAENHVRGLRIQELSGALQNTQHAFQKVLREREVLKATLAGVAAPDNTTLGIYTWRVAHAAQLPFDVTRYTAIPKYLRGLNHVEQM